VNERPSQWSPAATDGDGSPGELANARCALCGIELSIISLVPDGGPGSAEVRWYCRDIVSCTERWTADQAWRTRHAPVPHGNAPDLGAEPVAGEQAVASGGQAPVPGDAPAPAGELVPAEELVPAGELVPTEELAPAEEPGPAEEPRRPRGPGEATSAPGSPAGADAGTRAKPQARAPGHVPATGRRVADGTTPTR
jgi:hypothetical protein